MEFEMDQEESTDNTLRPDFPIDRCCICFTDPPNNPVKLECDHTFCFLCIKGASDFTSQCSLCRTEIRDTFFIEEHEVEGALKLPAPSKDGKYWLYSGYRGWWLYDSETSKKLETSYQSGERICDIYITNKLYKVDFVNMNQQLYGDEQTRVRNILRSDLNVGTIHGIAGLKPSEFDTVLDMMKTANSDQ